MTLIESPLEFIQQQQHQLRQQQPWDLARPSLAPALKTILKGAEPAACGPPTAANKSQAGPAAALANLTNQRDADSSDGPATAAAAAAAAGALGKLSGKPISSAAWERLS